MTWSGSSTRSASAGAPGGPRLGRHHRLQGRRRPPRTGALGGLAGHAVRCGRPGPVHGWWFKAEGLAEEFFARHARAFIEVMLGGRDGADLPGAPASPWAVPAGPGTAHRGWIGATLPLRGRLRRRTRLLVGGHPVLPLRTAFHGPIGDDGQRPPAVASMRSAEMWLHPGGLDAAPPVRRTTMDFAPEDRSTSLWPRPLATRRLAWAGAAGTSPRPAPNPIGRRAGQPLLAQFGRYFPHLRAQPIERRPLPRRGGAGGGERGPHRLPARLI